MKKRNGSYRRGFAAIIALLLVFAILISGTYALQMGSLTADAGGSAPATGRLHNDFEVMGSNFGEREWQQGMRSNKNVYVENFADSAGQDIFVRLRLYEYMEIGAGAQLSPDDAGFAGRSARPLSTGAARENPATWSPRVPGAGSASDLFRDYWHWDMGGQKSYMPTFNRDPMSREPDIKGDTVSPQSLQFGELPNTTRPGGAYTYAASAGLRNFFETNRTHTAQMKYWDASGHAITPYTVTHTARRTLDSRIVRMADWSKTPDNVWVIDADGWAYWAAPLSPETATGLLLDAITLIGEPSAEWYYAIYVEAQMATADDWKTVFTADPEKVPSPDGEELMNIITAKPDDNPAKDVGPGGTFTDSNGNVWRVLAVDGSGNKLIITEHVHGLGTMYHMGAVTANSYVRLQDTNRLRPALNTWYDTNLGSELRTRALPANNLDNDVRSGPSMPWDWDLENAPAGWTSAGTGTAAANTALFVLSISEVNRYSAAGTLNQIARDPNGNARLWWLRSPGTGTTGPASNVRENGQIAHVNSTAASMLTVQGFRPAMWITVAELN